MNLSRFAQSSALAHRLPSLNPSPHFGFLQRSPLVQPHNKYFDYVRFCGCSVCYFVVIAIVPPPLLLLLLVLLTTGSCIASSDTSFYIFNMLFMMHDVYLSLILYLKLITGKEK